MHNVSYAHIVTTTLCCVFVRLRMLRLMTLSLLGHVYKFTIIMAVRSPPSFAGRAGHYVSPLMFI